MFNKFYCMKSILLLLMRRLKARTPRWFRVIRNSGLILSAISVCIVSFPIDVPSVLTNAAGYCAIGGAVATVVAQTAVESE